MLALVLQHLYDDSENLFFSDGVHVPYSCSIEGWNMSERPVLMLALVLQNLYDGFENLLFSVLFLLYMFPTNVILFDGTCLCV
jgi:hypothetical protein